MAVDVFRTVICKHCGKSFVPAPEHAYKDSYGIYCSWHCGNAAYNEREAKKLEKKRAAKSRVKTPRVSINKGAKHKRAGRRPYAVLQYTNDGDFVARYNSAKEASRATGVGTSTIHNFANGTKGNGKGFVWAYEYKTEE